jgi:hypothetical protein
MRDKRRKRTREAKRRSERRTIDRIMRAAFMGENMYIMSALLIWENTRTPVSLRDSRGNEIVRFLLTKNALNQIRHSTELSPREALAFLQEHKAHAIYPKIS